MNTETIKIKRDSENGVDLQNRLYIDWYNIDLNDIRIIKYPTYESYEKAYCKKYNIEFI